MDIGSLVSRAWQRLSADFVNCILVFFVGTLVAAIAGGLTLGILGIPVMAGMFKSFRNVARGGRADMNDLFSEFSRIGYWFKLWLVLIIAGVAFGILAIIPVLGAIIIFVGEILLAYLLWFAIPLMLDQGLEAFDAVKQSIETMKNNVSSLLGPVIVTILIIDAGALVLGIGMLVTAPLGYIMLWLCYDQFYGAGATAPVVPAYVPPASDATVAPPPPPPSDTTL